MKLFFFIVLLLVISCTKVPPTSEPTLGTNPDIKTGPLPGPKPEGQVVGTGGDSIRALFEAGRHQAIRIMERAFINPSTAFPLSTTEIVWLSSHKDTIINDLRNSNYIWINQLPSNKCPQHTCACTMPNSKSDVFLSLEKCDSKSTFAQVGQLLLHESLHHFEYVGEDEQKADRISYAVYSQWKQFLYSDQPQWLKVNPKGAPDRKYRSEGTRKNGKSLALRMDDQIVIWDPEVSKEMFIYDSAKEEWNQKRLELSELGAGNGKYCRAMSFLGVAVAGKLAIFCRFVPFNVMNNGFIVDPKSTDIIEINPMGAPVFESYMAQAATSNDKILVVGGNPDFSGGLFSPSTNTWEAISNKNSPEGREDFSLELVADQAFVWGGNGGDSRMFSGSGDYRDYKFARMLNTGAVYSLTQKKWTPIPTAEAPGARMGHLSAWTGTELLIFGGESNQNDRVTCLYSGGLFNPVTNTWKQMAMTGAPAPDPGSRCEDNYTAMWIGTHLVVFTKDEVGYYSPFQNSWVTKRRFDGLGSFGYHIPLWNGVEVFLWNVVERNAFKFLP